MRPVLKIPNTHTQKDKRCHQLHNSEAIFAEKMKKGPLFSCCWLSDKKKTKTKNRKQFQDIGKPLRQKESAWSGLSG
jgi:hypothetical protein